MIICTTPSLGFSPTIEDEAYPYDMGTGLASPQVGSVVDTVDTDDGTGARYVFTEDDGVYSWEPETT